MIRNQSTNTFRNIDFTRLLLISNPILAVSPFLQSSVASSFTVHGILVLALIALITFRWMESSLVFTNSFRSVSGNSI